MKTAPEKVKVASFDFTGCEGCQLSKIDLEDEIVPLVQNFIEFVTFREAMDPVSDDYRIAFIEGSISTPGCVRRIRKIRRKAEILVAIGACATHGGPQAMRNNSDISRTKRESYAGDESQAQLDSLPWSLPVNKVVKVDFAIPGCPMDKYEFVRVVQSLLMGKMPKLPPYPVCVECKRKENECVYDLGFPGCMGPVTRAGCDARCPTAASPCIGCRGVMDDLNKNSQIDILAKVGLTPQEIVDKFSWFCSYRDLEGKEKEIGAVLAQIQ